MFQINIGPSHGTIKLSATQCKNSESIQLIHRYEIICRPTHHATMIWIELTLKVLVNSLLRNKAIPLEWKIFDTIGSTTVLTSSHGKQAIAQTFPTLECQSWPPPWSEGIAALAPIHHIAHQSPAEIKMLTFSYMLHEAMTKQILCIH